MVILENIDIDIDIDNAILQNIDIDKISNRFKFGKSNRAIWYMTDILTQYGSKKSSIKKIRLEARLF